MEYNRPDREPGYQTIYKVGLLMSFVIAFDLEAFDYMEETFRTAKHHTQYLVLGLCWGVGAVVGALMSDIICKKIRSLTKTATFFTLLTVPGLVYFMWLVNLNHKHKSPNQQMFVYGIVCQILAGLGVGGLYVAGASYASKQAPSLTAGLQFGYFGVAVSFKHVVSWIFQYYVNQKSSYACFAIIITLGMALCWQFMEEETDANYADSFDEKDFSVVFPSVIRYVAFALTAHACDWCVERMLEDTNFQPGLVSMAYLILFPCAIGASILFGFGFDKRANWVSNAWGVLALLALLTYVLTDWAWKNPDARWMVFACMFGEMVHVGALCYFLAWVTTRNKGDQISGVASWMATWFAAWLVVFIIFENVTNNFRLFFFGVFTLVALMQAFTTTFNHENDIYNNLAQVDDDDSL